MCSEELKKLVYLAIEPNEFDNHKRHVIYKRAKKEGASKEEVDSLIFTALAKKRHTIQTTTDKEFHKSFFLKRVYVNGSRFWVQEIYCDGKSIKARRKHRYFLWGKPKERSLPLDDMIYFDIFSKIGIRKRAEFGAYDNQWNVRLKKDFAIYVRDVCINNFARFSWPDSRFIKSQITKQHKLTQPFLWVNNDYITLSHNCFGGTEWRTCVPVREVAFFCKDINTRNTNIYFGYHDQIEIDAIKHQEAEILEEHCKNHKAKIGAEKLHEFKPAFSLSKYVTPSNWFKKERIALTEEAIIYYCKSLLKTECTYLPYDDVRVADFDWGFFGKTINLFGIQNIMTHFKYSKSDCISIIKDELNKHGILGRLAQKRKTWPWFKCFGADVVVMTNDGLCLSAHEYKNEGEYASRKNYYFPYKNIYHYEKFWWWLLWRTYYIYAKEDNIRKDQKATTVQFKLRRMIFWCGVYNRLENSNAVQNKKYYHEECKDDNKNY